MQQESDGDALVLAYPKEDEDARDEHRDDNRDDADRRRDEMGHAVLEPCDDHAEARQEERQDKEPQGDRVDREGEGEFHRTDFLRASALGSYVKAFVYRKMRLQFTTRTGHGRKVAFPDMWPSAQLLPTEQCAFPVTTGPKLRVPVVSGKPHRKMPQRAVLLKGFRIRCEVSANLRV